jgi:hypothetical protein
MSFEMTLLHTAFPRVPAFTIESVSSAGLPITSLLDHPRRFSAFGLQRVMARFGPIPISASNEESTITRCISSLAHRSASAVRRSSDSSSLSASASETRSSARPVT